MMDISSNNWLAMSDGSLVETIGAFVKHHRLVQNKTQQQLATEAGLNRSTITQIEKGEKITLQSLLQVLRVLNLLYIMDVFKVQEQLSPLQLAKLEQNKRQRARKNLPAARKENNNNDNKSDW
ncbi:MAG: helix-turn-helix domain-containing protein [Flavobacterium sp.]|nr:helix-turn-helix domain-containing protein [Flavobacterium sp.]